MSSPEVSDPGPLESKDRKLVEVDPSQGNFRVEVKHPDLIFESTLNKVSGTIASETMDSPIKETNVELISSQGHFDLIGTIDMDNTTEYGLSYKLAHEIAARYITNNPNERLVKDGSNYIITSDNGNRFVLTPSNQVNSVIITTGLYVSDFNEDVSRLLPSPANNRETFDSVVNDFTRILSETIRATYKNSAKPIPKDTFILGPPGAIPKQSPRFDYAEELSIDEMLRTIEIQKPSVKFEDVGGQEEAKKAIQSLAFALKNPELYEKWGTHPPKGILLYGPPGTGKTLLAKALASESDARFLYVEPSDIASKWYGDSERIIKKIFDAAAVLGGKTIIFFDEMDSIAPRRDEAHEATRKVVGTMLENMDGLSSRDNVMVIASTNRPDDIDKALLRAGRFDRWIGVPLPNEDARQQIFDIHIEKANARAQRKLFNKLDFAKIIPMMEGASGADIAEIIRRTLEEKVRQAGTGQDTSHVTTKDLIDEIDKYERIKKNTTTPIGFQSDTP